MNDLLKEQMGKACRRRAEFFSDPHDKAFRLFHGFTEGNPLFAVDVFAQTAVIHDYAEYTDSVSDTGMAHHLPDVLNKSLPWLKCVILKERNASDVRRKNGTIVFGSEPDTRIRENGVSYAIDLLMNQDCSFYPDTRNLRKWLKENMSGKSVLNTFAYTGSLGVAALAGNAKRVLQLDLNKRFLSMAKRSCELNGFRCDGRDLWAKDFFRAIGKLKRENVLFDCVILDPPFFSKTSSGTIDQKSDPVRLINKVRPLVRDGGVIVNINNALFLSGEDYLSALNSVCDGVYLSLREIIPIPDDFIGNPDVPPSILYPVSPEPFNHPTKIVILDVKRKPDGKTE